MLYDNALLVRVYVAAFQLTGNPWYRQIAEESLGYLLRDLRSPAGAFIRRKTRTVRVSRASGTCGRKLR
jgi:uncharacterized protein YyaL (SSP411 family)